MPRYRVLYVGRSPNRPFDSPNTRDRWWDSYFGRGYVEPLAEVRYEDVIEARNETAALEQFFQNHVEQRTDVRYLGSDGRSHEIRGLDDFNPKYTHLWIEDDVMMEYQGMEELTPGTATCPLCSGTGEVDAGLADHWEQNWAEVEKQ